MSALFLLKKLVSVLLLPPTGLVLASLVGILLLGWSKWRRAGAALAIGALAILLVLSMPSAAALLAASLFVHEPLSVQAVEGVSRRADAIVVLSGGTYPRAAEYGAPNVGPNTMMRLRYGAWLQRRTRLPILLSGGAPDGGLPEADTLACILLEEYGIKARWVERESMDTRDNADMSAKMLLPQGIRKVVLVTDALHMRRAMTEFERTGLIPIPAPVGRSAARKDDSAAPSLAAYLPAAGALATSSSALKEWLGLLAIRMRGV